MSNAVPEYKVFGVGAIQYDPQRADPSKGFGPYEVHPQKIPALHDGALSLEYNGDWLLLFSAPVDVDESRQLLNFVVTEAAGGRVTAEKLAAIRNEGLPTRVVDLSGEEHVSAHTKASVEAELAAKAQMSRH